MNKPWRITKRVCSRKEAARRKETLRRHPISKNTGKRTKQNTRVDLTIYSLIEYWILMSPSMIA